MSSNKKTLTVYLFNPDTGAFGVVPEYIDLQEQYINDSFANHEELPLFTHIVYCYRTASVFYKLIHTSNGTVVDRVKSPHEDYRLTKALVGLMDGTENFFWRFETRANKPAPPKEPVPVDSVDISLENILKGLLD